MWAQFWTSCWGRVPPALIKVDLLTSLKEFLKEIVLRLYQAKLYNTSNESFISLDSCYLPIALPRTWSKKLFKEPWMVQELVPNHQDLVSITECDMFWIFSSTIDQPDDEDRGGREKDDASNETFTFQQK